jgi:SAM-dependent methyltransferase
VADGVTVFVHDCTRPWPLADESLDVVFTSNFFEHLATSEDLRSTLTQAARCLRPGGRLIAMGPNVRLVPGAYWDFIDHHLPLSERSMCEVLSERGFDVQRSVPAFLPYTMSDGRRYPLIMLRLYLKIPLVWRVVGRQFLVIASRPPDAST